MTALMCCGFEQILSPVMEKVRNARYNSKIANMLEETNNMSLNIDDIESNSLSKKVEKMLATYKNREISKAEVDKLVKLLANDSDEILTAGIREDL